MPDGFDDVEMQMLGRGAKHQAYLDGEVTLEDARLDALEVLEVLDDIRDAKLQKHAAPGEISFKGKDNKDLQVYRRALAALIGGLIERNHGDDIERIRSRWVRPNDTPEAIVVRLREASMGEGPIGEPSPIKGETQFHQLMRKHGVQGALVFDAPDNGFHSVLYFRSVAKEGIIAVHHEFAKLIALSYGVTTESVLGLIFFRLQPKLEPDFRSEYAFTPSVLSRSRVVLSVTADLSPKAVGEIYDQARKALPGVDTGRMPSEKSLETAVFAYTVCPREMAWDERLVRWNERSDVKERGWTYSNLTNFKTRAWEARRRLLGSEDAGSKEKDNEQTS